MISYRILLNCYWNPCVQSSSRPQRHCLRCCSNVHPSQQLVYHFHRTPITRLLTANVEVPTTHSLQAFCLMEEEEVQRSLLLLLSWRSAASDIRERLRMSVELAADVHTQHNASCDRLHIGAGSLIS